jgi:crotonobetainyl-CoA:carnitine CoA-transferase CaiB-like acyl-CoA transferase
MVAARIAPASSPTTARRDQDQRPGAGDITPHWGPFPNDVPDIEKSRLFFLNTRKRGVTPTLARAPADLLGLLRQADVFIRTSGRRCAMGPRLRVDREGNPELVMISLTPYGQTGPYSDWNSYDLNAYHLSGTGHRYCGRPGEAPLEHGTFSAEFFGAIAGAAWGLAATYGRELAGGGQQIDVSCAEAIAALFVGAQNIGGYAQDGVFNSRTGVGMPLGAPATILPCKDGYVWMLALEPAQWNGLASVMGNPTGCSSDVRDMFVRAQNAGRCTRSSRSGRWSTKS